MLGFLQPMVNILFERVLLLIVLGCRDLGTDVLSGRLEWALRQLVFVPIHSELTNFDMLPVQLPVIFPIRSGKSARAACFNWAREMLTYLPTCLLILFELQNTPISVPDLHHDAQQLLRFGQLIGESTSHLYLSALSFVPEGCPIDRHFSFDLDKRPIICYGRSIHWPSQQASLVGHDDCINCAAFSSDGRRIVSGSSDRTIRLSDAETGALLGEPLRGHDDSINCVAFSSNGKHVVSCWGDRAVRLSDADTGVPVGDPLQGHGDSVASVAFSLDGRRIVSGSSDCTL